MGRINVKPEKFVEEAKEENVDIVAISCVMYDAIQNTKILRILMDKTDWKGKKPILAVGGAPFNMDPTLWQRIGADKMVSSAIDAPRIFKELLKERAIL